jgi:biopolymer transport protein ExbB
VLLETGLRGCREREFGTTFRGTAVNAQGRAVEGAFAVAGPFTFFVGADVAGVAAEREDSSLAHVFTSLPDAGKAAIRTLVREGKADVPVDVSGGRALRAGEERWAVARRLRQGGFVMVPLVLVAAAAVWVSLGRWRALRRLGTGWAATVRAAAETAVAGRTEAAQRRVEELPLPFRSVFAAGLQNRNAPREHLEELLHEMILSCLPTLEKHLGTLAVLGGVAPLLGLLGTVTGMIHTFQMITQFGAGGAKMLSGGISEALVTTEFGLVIAIPVTLVHAYFARRVRATVGDLESWAVTFVDILKSGGEPVS